MSSRQRRRWQAWPSTEGSRTEDYGQVLKIDEHRRAIDLRAGGALASGDAGLAEPRGALGFRQMADGLQAPRTELSFAGSAGPGADANRSRATDRNRRSAGAHA